MSNLQLRGKVEVVGQEVPDIAGGFREGKRSMLAKDIAGFHNKKTWRVNESINNNLSRFRVGIDIINIKGLDFALDLVESGIISQNSYNASNSIYLLSERGYAKLIKMFDDDLSWEMYDKLLDDYFEMKENKQSKQPTNQFDMLRGMIDTMEEMNNRITKAEQEAEEANKQVASVKDTFAQIDNNWRDYANDVFTRIGKHTGDYRGYRNESYIMLDREAGVNLDRRLKNKRNRMKKSGATKTDIQETNKLDVIAEDKKLIKIYVNIVQEFEIKYL